MSVKQIVCPHCNEVFDMSDDMAAHIREQVRTKEFDEELQSRLAIQQDAAARDAEAKVKEAIIKEREKYERQLNDVKDEKRQAEITIAELNSELKLVKDSAAKTLDLELKQKELDLRAEHSAAIADLQSELKGKEIELSYYKDLKSKMSTKMVGETLERHCEIEFNKIRMAAFPRAEFGKDNTVSKETGSKGDYIFRERDEDGTELLSIMFEMKNEMDTTATKKTNESFLKELDKDRKEKNCEYAVLVSLLESDNDLYNQGIVDVSYLYPKTYVIRPQFFIPIISLLRNASLNSVESKRELQKVKNQNIDIANFKDNFEEFKKGFAYNCSQSDKRMDEAIDEIAKAIKRLEAVKTALEASRKQLKTANEKATEMTVEKLCKNSYSLMEKLSDDE